MRASGKTCVNPLESSVRISSSHWSFSTVMPFNGFPPFFGTIKVIVQCNIYFFVLCTVLST